MKRPHYPTKAAWAAAQAESLRAQANALQAERLPSAQWRRVRRKAAAIDTLQREARRFEALARRLAG